jgi:hypothetical protein
MKTKRVVHVQNLVRAHFKTRHGGFQPPAKCSESTWRLEATAKNDSLEMRSTTFASAAHS